MHDDLPPLPQGEYMGSCNGVPSYRYTADQMRAYARIAVAQRDAEIARLTTELDHMRMAAEQEAKFADERDAEIERLHARIDAIVAKVPGAVTLEDAWGRRVDEFREPKKSREETA